MFLADDGTVAVSDMACAEDPRETVISISAVCGFDDTDAVPDGSSLGAFGYLFGQTSLFPDDPRMADALDALAMSMVDAPISVSSDSDIPPIFTCFGQFIEHDILATAEMIAGLSAVDAPIVEPLSRKTVAQNLKNLRSGKLELGSVYGKAAMQGPWSERFSKLLRSSDDPAKLRAGSVAPGRLKPIPNPRDPSDRARDVLRLGHVLDSERPALNSTDVEMLPPSVRAIFTDRKGGLRRQRALTGDLRNDKNLLLSQFHLAWVRLHNRFVTCIDNDQGPNEDREAVFDHAAKMVRWHYQWLVINAFLPAVCDAKTLKDIMGRGSILYDQFVEKTGQSGDQTLPIPLEFSTAAFRFGHAMMRESYDWNRIFGRLHDEPLDEYATLELLHRMTGNGDHPMSSSQEIPSAPSVPEHWSIEWDRFIYPPCPDMPERSARRIMPNLSKTQSFDIFVETSQDYAVPQDLARLDLRRSTRFNLPSAQDCITQINAITNIPLRRLSSYRLGSGPTGSVVQEGRFDEHTPIWFYILKEAEVLGQGGRLGPLGTHLIADTLLGLITHDEDSFWHVGEGNGSWHPKDGICPDGVEITSMPALMEAAQLL